MRYPHAGFLAMVLLLAISSMSWANLTCNVERDDGLFTGYTSFDDAYNKLNESGVHHKGRIVCVSDATETITKTYDFYNGQSVYEGTLIQGSDDKDLFRIMEDGVKFYHLFLYHRPTIPAGTPGSGINLYGSKYVEITGVTFINMKYGVYSDTSGADPARSATAMASIKDCVFMAFQDTAIKLDNAYMEGVIVDHCQITDIKGSGIEVYNYPGNTLELIQAGPLPSYIKDCLINRVTGNGIKIKGGHITIQNNRIQQTKLAGVAMETAYDATIIGNIIHGAGDNIVGPSSGQLFSAFTHSAYDNTPPFVNSDGISFGTDCQNMKICDNEIFYNGGNGVNYKQPLTTQTTPVVLNLTIANNRIHSNGQVGANYAGILLNSYPYPSYTTSNIIIEGNHCYNQSDLISTSPVRYQQYGVRIPWPSGTNKYKYVTIANNQLVDPYHTGGNLVTLACDAATLKLSNNSN